MKYNKLNPFKLDFDSYILQSEPEKQENGKLWNKLEAEGLIVGTGENKNRTYSLKKIRPAIKSQQIIFENL